MHTAYMECCMHYRQTSCCMPHTHTYHKTTHIDILGGGQAHGTHEHTQVMSTTLKSRYLLGPVADCIMARALSAPSCKHTQQEIGHVRQGSSFDGTSHTPQMKHMAQMKHTAQEDNGARGYCKSIWGCADTHTQDTDVCKGCIDAR